VGSTGEKSVKTDILHHCR